MISVGEWMEEHDHLDDFRFTLTDFWTGKRSNLPFASTQLPTHLLVTSENETTAIVNGADGLS